MVLHGKNILCFGDDNELARGSQCFGRSFIMSNIIASFLLRPFARWVGCSNESVAAVLACDPDRPSIAAVLWDLFDEQFPMSGHTRVFPMHQEISKGLTAVFKAYIVIGNEQQAIVYHIICEKDDPVAAEYFFLELLKDTNLVPRMYFMSQPLEGSIILNNLNLINHGKIRISRDTCSVKPHVPLRVRYIVMEFLPGDIMAVHSQSGESSVHDAAVVGKMLIESLQALHASNVVHGNIEPTNVMMNADGVLKLIDFKRASLWDKTEPILNCIDANLNVKDIKSIGMWDSPWEAKGCVPSFRDDVYRAILVIAYMVHGSPYLELFDTLAHVANRPGMKTAWIALRTNPANLFNMNTNGYENLPKHAHVHLHVPGRGILGKWLHNDDSPETVLFGHIAARALRMRSNDPTTIPYREIILLLNEIERITAK